MGLPNVPMLQIPNIVHLRKIPTLCHAPASKQIRTNSNQYRTSRTVEYQHRDDIEQITVPFYLWYNAHQYLQFLGGRVELPGVSVKHY